MPPENLNRDKMYSGDGGNADDGDYELAPIEAEPAPTKPARPASIEDDDDEMDLELEPVDEAILAAAKRRAEETVVAATRAIDLDQIYRDAEPIGEVQLPSELFENFKFQFQVKHLLIATAVIAVLLAIRTIFGSGGAIALVFMLSVFAATAYFHVLERKRQAVADRRRHEMYAARREHFESRGPRSVGATVAADSVARGLTPEDFKRVAPRPAVDRTPIRGKLTVGQWFAAGGIAALLIWIVYLVGGIQNCAAFFGIISMIGLSAYALGWDQPDVLVFTWCVGLAFSIGIGMLMAIWRGIAG
jgi:hypothetical protein